MIQSIKSYLYSYLYLPCMMFMSITVLISIFSMFFTVITHPELIVVHSILNGFGLLIWRGTEEKE